MVRTDFGGGLGAFINGLEVAVHLVGNKTRDPAEKANCQRA